ncbi:MAG: hypothetical protein B7X57_07045 [Erythrobacter sp. 34-65-8]|nr:MAG: hypothetical protein B7X57_07045 [Erythrobacter sp. 34-65-8]
MLHDSLPDLIRVLIVSTLAYIGLVLILRKAGKRSLAKLNAFDLVVTVALGSILATTQLSREVSLLEGLLAIALLALLQWTVSRFSIVSTRFRKLVRSEPRLLLENGVFREDAMRAERLTRSEIEASIRSAGIGRIEDVAAVIIESDGSLSVIPERGDELTVLRSVKR